MVLLIGVIIWCQAPRKDRIWFYPYGMDTLILLEIKRVT
jgi:hypothetical protein